MSTLRNPVGPQPSSVYWRRRIVFSVVILAVIAVILLIVFRPGGGDGTPAGSETPPPGSSESEAPDTGEESAAPDPEDTETAEPGEAATCSPSAVRVTPVVSAESFAAGEDPELSMEIVNIGAAACTFDVGTRQMEFLIMSGTDRIWSSVDCQSDPSEQLMLLEPNQTLTTDPPLVWDRTRSSADTCTGDRPEVVAGGSTYRLSAILGEASSAGDVPFLLY